MVYTYTPTYYSTIHESITSLCKNILPFSFKKRRLPAAEHRLSKLQSDNLKWQQDSYHQILNLMGLHKEGILNENEVSAFRTHLLETLIASPPEHEQPLILKDKLIFLQELLYAKCISEDEYHSSKRPLLQRLAVQGAEIEARDVFVAGPKDLKENPEEKWSIIDLKDEKSLVSKENFPFKNRPNPNSVIKQQIKGAVSVFGFGSSHKLTKHRDEKSIFDIEANGAENPVGYSETKSILMQQSLPNESANENGSNGKIKRKPFRNLIMKDHVHDGGGGENCVKSEEKLSKSAKKQWGFKKWSKKNDSDDETNPLPLNNERSDYGSYREGPDTKLIKKKLHSDGSASDFFIDKVLGDKIKKELSRIQTELCTTNPNLKFSDDQMEAISTKLPVEKAHLKQFFPKSWCDRYGDVVLDVVKKEFKEHVGEMENMRNASRENHNTNSKRWTTFEDNDYENCHPNLFAHSNNSHLSSSKNFENNPFYDDHSESIANKHRSEYQNPFWSPRHSSSLFG
ncbi:uncharacterized protein LOC126666195 [Mercurialis annua]|uniref:uncharacterized protein LOC126666195 n=1 Tax=Mercurialis annua TaxID=3986 RepID=UPI00215FE4C7|nr:uncharacterized protein LOC126666195 [Mercurialis annua]